MQDNNMVEWKFHNAKVLLIDIEELPDLLFFDTL